MDLLTDRRRVQLQDTGEFFGMPWDYFISHAYEDKDLVARPLAHALTEYAFSVWYDEFSLRVGDSLFQSISHGLAESSFGIVILSPSFMQKSWTQNELGGIWAREVTGERLLLPVWHRVTATQVAQRAPMLADRVAVSTAKGLQHVAEEIVRGSFPDRVAQLPFNLQETRESKTRQSQEQFRELVNNLASIDDLRLFLSAHQELPPRNGILIPAHKIEAAFGDFILVTQHGITGSMVMDIVLLGPLNIDQSAFGHVATSLTESLRAQLGARRPQKQGGFNDHGPPYVGEFESLLKIGTRAVELLTSEKPLSPGGPLDDLLVRRTTGDHIGDWNIHMLRPDLWSVRLTIFLGRRDLLALWHKSAIVERFGNFVSLASYDRLLDSAGGY